METKWAALGLLAVLGGCVVESLSQVDSVAAFWQGRCDGQAEVALEFVASPFYWGNEGALPRDEVESRFTKAIEESHRQDGATIECSERFDFDRMESLTPVELETRFQIVIDDLVMDYEPGSDDRYVLVPAHPDANSDDPLQGFWRPDDGRWRHVAMFD